MTTGFGRGSAAMGTPTANLPPEPLQEQLAGLPLGVYFGCAFCLLSQACVARCDAADFRASGSPAGICCLLCGAQ